MKFTYFQSYIPTIEKATLGGLTSQFRLAPKMRLNYSQDKIKANDPRHAAVLALFYPDSENETCFLLTLRASYNGTHSAQISFPGGKAEKTDTSFNHTAKRETYEEVGIEMSDIKIIKELTDAYIPPSNFLVTPFLGTLDTIPSFITNDEVEEIIEVRLSDLLDESNITLKNMSTSYMKNIEIPCFILNDHIVWGATAMILIEIKDLLKAL